MYCNNRSSAACFMCWGKIYISVLDRLNRVQKNRVKKSGQGQNRRLIESSIKSGFKKKNSGITKKSGFQKIEAYKSKKEHANPKNRVKKEKKWLQKQGT